VTTIAAPSLCTRRRRSSLAGKLVVDIFAGAGGASLGIRHALGREIDHALNHDPEAVEVHELNHPRTRHHCADAVEAAPLDVTGGKPVGLAWFSPDCTHHSRAKGGKPRDKNIRALAWVVVRWAREVRPDVIMLENVPEFAAWGPLDESGRPCRARKGRTFRAWVAALEEIGYDVEWRMLCAADYGAPTIRKRLFLVARCDGRPIRWPKATHAPRHKAEALGLKPWVPAAVCIDWSLPVYSIFMTPEEVKARGLRIKRPLAEATMRRLAHGVFRFVIDAKEPFIVRCNHGGDEFRGQSITDPMCTLTSSRDAHGLVVPSLAQTGYGEREGQTPRSLDIQEPLGTVVGGGCKHALVAAFLAKHYGGVVGQACDEPLGTITGTDHHSLAAVNLLKLRGMGGWSDAAQPLDTICAGAPTFGVVASHLEHMRGTGRGLDAREPMPTITAGGNHVAEVRVFLEKYYRTAKGQDAGAPLDTITATARFGVVAVCGMPLQISDVAMRMFKPHELLRAQFGSYASEYKLIGSDERKTHAIGNSVCPDVADALVRTNFVEGE
jgi:DNA (cytosine-5)-methyltransferase 1